MGHSADSAEDRYRSQAFRSASQSRVPTLDRPGAAIPSSLTPPTSTANTNAGGLDSHHGRGGPPSRPTPTPLRDGTPDDRHHQQRPDGRHMLLDGAGDRGAIAEESTHNSVADATSHAAPPPAPPPHTEDASSGDSPIASTEKDENNISSNQKTKEPRAPVGTRIKNGCLRFGKHLKDAICRSWINLLLVAVPAGIAVEAAGLNPSVVFAINAVAIIPLAGLLTHATESVAARVGDSWGALLNISFGNAVELIIFIIALAKDEIAIVQASLLGSILANLLLILGMAFLLGGLRFREQIYNNTVTQMSACLLTLSVMSLLLPTAFHASFNDASQSSANTKVLEVSRGTSIILLFVYGLYLLFQLKSHAYMYESTPQAIIDEESHPGVLADIMNSSSSSDSDSSSSSDSSSDGSGSVATTSKKVKRMFTHRKRRKSSAGSATSSNRTGPGVGSVLSSPSTQEKEDYFLPVTNTAGSRRQSALATPNGDDADADKEDNGVSRVFDWATKRNPSHDGSNPPDAKESKKRHRKKQSKKHRKHRNKDGDAEDPEKAAAAESDKNEAAEFDGQPKVNFADDIQVVPSEPASTPATQRSTFNMRGLSSRAPFRPAMTKMLSNNVFVQPPPTATPAARPTAIQAQSTGNLRRTNSLPDRLNRQTTPGAASQTEPVPPYQRQARYPLHKVTPKPSKTVASAQDDEDEEPEMSKTAAIVLLLISTGLVAACAEFMVDAIPSFVGDGSGVSQAFIGLIILPIVGNAAEHVTAVTVATKNKMDLAIGVAVGSSIQIALFVTPVVVLLGWILNTNMSLYFNLFETVSLFVTVFVVNFLVLDGRSNYMEGALLMAAYVIIAVVAFYYPSDRDQSSIGGGAGDGTGGSKMMMF